MVVPRGCVEVVRGRPRRRGGRSQRRQHNYQHQEEAVKLHGRDSPPRGTHGIAATRIAVMPDVNVAGECRGRASA